MIGVFGGSGFIGRNLVQLLGDSKTPFKIFSRTPVESMNARNVVFDFEDPESYASHLENLTSAVLLVSASVPGTFADDMPSEILHNVLPHARFLKLAGATDIRRIIFLSSGGTVYGTPQSEFLDEAHPTNPISPYGSAKLMIEQMIMSMSHHADWDFTILRASNPVGRFQNSGRQQGIVAKAVEMGLAGKPMQIWGDGSVVRDYFDVQDLTRAIVDCLEDQAGENRVLNIGSGDGLSLLEVVAIVEKALGREIDIEFTANRTIDIPRNVLDISAFQTFSGWKPNRLSQKAVQDIAESVR